MASRLNTGTFAGGDASETVEFDLSTSGSLLATGHKEGVVSVWDARPVCFSIAFSSDFDGGRLRTIS